jgi:hypothetical protein
MGLTYRKSQMALEDRYRKGKKGIQKRDAELAKRGTTAGKEAAKRNINETQFKEHLFGASDATPTRGTKMTTPRSEYQDAQEDAPKPKSDDMLF